MLVSKQYFLTYLFPLLLAVLIIVLAVLISVPTSSIAQGCETNPEDCTPRSLCEKSTENIDNSRYWIGDESNEFLKTARKFGLDCNAKAALSACERSADKCSIVELCEIATHKTVGSTFWLASKPDHVRLAKQFGLQCGIERISSTPQSPTTKTPAQRCLADIDRCSEAELCNSATFKSFEEYKWRALPYYAELVDEAKRRGLSCKVNKNNSFSTGYAGCTSSIKTCSQHELCEVATWGEANKRWQSGTYYERFVVEAKSRGLSCGVMDLKAKAERNQQEAKEEAKLQAEAEAKRRAAQETRLTAEAKAKRKAAEEARLAAEAKAKRKAEEEARLAAEAKAKRKAEEESPLNVFLFNDNQMENMTIAELNKEWELNHLDLFVRLSSKSDDLGSALHKICNNVKSKLGYNSVTATICSDAYMFCWETEVSAFKEKKSAELDNSDNPFVSIMLNGLIQGVASSLTLTSQCYSKAITETRNAIRFGNKSLEIRYYDLKGAAQTNVRTNNNSGQSYKMMEFNQTTIRDPLNLSNPRSPYSTR